MRLVALLIATTCMALPTAAQDGGSMTPARGEALVIVDIQNFYFAGGALPLTGGVEAAKQARRVLDLFRERHLPIIHVRHLPASAQDGDAYRIRPEVTPMPGETVIVKHYANSFRDTSLLDELRKAGVTRLVICGMQTQMCVEATARAAADLGFEVIVVADACATRPLEYGGITVPADHVHAAALATLKGTYATVVTADELVSRK